MSEHAKLSPSAASRWLNCPGSVAATDGMADTSSAYAEEGSKAHAIAEACLTNQTDPLEYKDTVFGRDMAEHVAVYVDYVNGIKGDHAYEQKVDFSAWVPEGFGTADALIIGQDGKVHIVDLKFGKGIQVFAENNPQLMLYALGAWSELEMLQDVESFVLHICQPRLDHIDTWEISLSDLLAWGEWVKERAQLALSEDAPRIPGEAQCRWCRAQATCQALYDYTVKIVGAEFDDMDALENPGVMSDRQLRETLEAAPLIRSWLSAVEDHVFAVLNEGKTFPGYKLVEGRSLRKWADEKKAEEVLIDAIGDAAYEVQLLSPAKAEKALGKKKAALLDGLIIKPAGKPTLAPENDKRPPLQQAIAEQFELLQ